MRYKIGQESNVIASYLISHRGVIVSKSRTTHSTQADRNAETQRTQGLKYAREILKQ